MDDFIAFNACLCVDLLWRCFVSVRAMICGGVCVARMFCKSRMVVCIPLLVLRVRDVMEGWEYSDVVLGSVSCGGDVVVVGICGCMLGVGEGGSFVSGASCVVCVCVC